MSDNEKRIAEIKKEIKEWRDEIAAGREGRGAKRQIAALNLELMKLQGSSRSAEHQNSFQNGRDKATQAIQNKAARVGVKLENEDFNESNYDDVVSAALYPNKKIGDVVDINGYKFKIVAEKGMYAATKEFGLKKA